MAGGGSACDRPGSAGAESDRGSSGCKDGAALDMEVADACKKSAWLSEPSVGWFAFTTLVEVVPSTGGVALGQLRV